MPKNSSQPDFKENKKSDGSEQSQPEQVESGSEQEQPQ